jgi:hypothetical protein
MEAPSPYWDERIYASKEVSPLPSALCPQPGQHSSQALRICREDPDPGPQGPPPIAMLGGPVFGSKCHLSSQASLLGSESRLPAPETGLQSPAGVGRGRCGNRLDACDTGPLQTPRRPSSQPLNCHPRSRDCGGGLPFFPLVRWRRAGSSCQFRSLTCLLPAFGI